MLSYTCENGDFSLWDFRSATSTTVYKDRRFLCAQAWIDRNMVVLGWASNPGVIKVIDIRNPSKAVSTTTDPFCEGIGDIHLNPSKTGMSVSGFTASTIRRIDPRGREALLWSAQNLSEGKENITNTNWVTDSISVTTTCNGQLVLSAEGFDRDI